MTKNHVWRIKKQYFHQLKDGEKKLEVRVGYPQIKKVRKGDIISFENFDSCYFEVEDIRVYGSFEHMLQVEDVEMVFPGMTKEGALRTLRDIYLKDKEKLGVFVFELKYRPGYQEIRTASWLLEDGRRSEFFEMIREATALAENYSVNDPTRYINFFIVPGTRTREIIGCYMEAKLVAVAFLKRENGKPKIDRLYVSDSDCQEKGVPKAFIEKCFNWLGTTKPTIALSGKELSPFFRIIQKYDWKYCKTEINGSAVKYVFNS